MNSDYETLKAHGEEALKRKDFEAALASFQKALELEPNNPETFKNIGNVFIAKGEWDKAQLNYEVALEKDPNYWMALNNLGNLKQRQNKFDEAKAYYDGALLLARKEWLINMNLGVWFDIQEKYDEAKEYHTKALSLAPKESVIYLNLGLIACSLKGYQTAHEYFKQASVIEPELEETAYCIAYAFYQEEKIDQAIEYLQFALEKGTSYWQVYHLMAKISEKKGNLEEAKSFFKKAITTVSPSVSHYANLSSFALRLRLFLEFYEYAGKAFQLAPEDFFIRYLQGVALSFQAKPDEAIDLLQSSLDGLAKNQRLYAYYHLYNSFLNKNEGKQAKRWLEKYIELAPDKAFGYTYLGGYYYRNKDYEKTIQYKEKALELEPHNSDDYLFLARLHFLLGDYEKALLRRNQYIALRDKETVYDFYFRACIFYELNRQEEAFEQLEYVQAENIESLSELAKTFSESWEDEDMPDRKQEIQDRAKLLQNDFETWKS